MAKRKDLLLTEATTMRMMGLAGLKPLASSFLREQEEVDEIVDPLYNKMDEGMCESCGGKMEEGVCESCGPMKEGEELEEMADSVYEEDSVMEEELDELEEGEGEECEKCGESPCECEKEEEGGVNESIKASLKKLKTLLEQAEAPAEEPPAPEAAPAAEPPPAMEGGGDDEMEAKIKEFVKKLGSLVQETLGVEVTVEESQEEPEMPEAGAEEALPPPAEAAPAPVMQEAINRLVNKVAARVKARLMEAKKKDPKAAAKAKLMKEKQAAAKKKEEEAAAKKKKEMMMKKKKAAALKAKKK